MRPTPREQRKERRSRQYNEARIRGSTGAGEFFFSAGIPAETLDISPSGARVRAIEPFAVGDTLLMHIDLARARQTVSLQAVVRWVRREEEMLTYEFGVEFREMLPRTTLALMRSMVDEPSGLRVLLT